MPPKYLPITNATHTHIKDFCKASNITLKEFVKDATVRLLKTLETTNIQAPSWSNPGSVSVNIPDDLHKAVLISCAKQNIPLWHFGEIACTLFLADVLREMYMSKKQ